MDTCRILSRRHVSAAATVPFGIFSCTAALAQQVDDNFQQRVETYSPPFIAQPITPPLLETEVIGRADYQDEDLLKRLNKADPGRVRNLLRQFAPLQIQGLAAESSDPMAAARIAIRDPSFRKEAIRFLALPPYPVVYGLKAQPRTIKISIPLNPSYESNVLKSNTTVTPDRVFGIGAGVQMTGPGLPGRPLDVVGYSLSGTSARYDANPSKSVDLINGAMAYQIFLGAFGGRKTIDSTHPPPSGLSIGLITTDTLLVGFQNSVATVPTFRGYSSDLFTPQVVLSRQNIDLSDGKACFTSKDVAKKAGSFCTYADLSLGVGQTFSDYGTQEKCKRLGCCDRWAPAGRHGFYNRISSHRDWEVLRKISGRQTGHRLAGGPNDPICGK